MLPPLPDVPREPVLMRMQMEVPSSVEYPHQVGFLQIRQGRFLLTRWNPPDTGGVVVLDLLCARLSVWHFESGGIR